MEIFSYIWEYYLYIPLFNFLVWLYINYAFFNLGLAVIILTIMLRIALLPFTILTEKSKIVGSQLSEEISKIRKDFTGDTVKQKELIRLALKKRKLHPWAKAIVLGVQFLVLVLLYQVFVGGINSEAKLHLLYPSITRPDFINTKFLFLDIGQHNLFMAAVVAGYLFAEILINFWERRGRVSKQEQLYSLLFPASIFVLLAILPSVKSIFILTSLVFSSIISSITALVKFSIKQTKKSNN
ncbi:MAG: YidC/Oxa1 family membrane protein insertase [Patescibacteria group bacterium]|jgi:YidC/Oxa1 family membrane protein insertase|nr:YidC/Oxa1 family membrane protein insertase [Patescibacteria group bacterium]